MTHGSRDGLALETRYAVDLAEPTRLRVRSRTRARGGGRAALRLRNRLSRTSTRSRPSRSTRERSALPAASRSSRSSAWTATRSRTLPCRRICWCWWATPVSRPASPTRCGSATARLERASGERVELPRLLLADDVASISAVFVRPFWIGDGRSLGTLQFLQTRLMDLAVGDALVIEQEIWVGSARRRGVGDRAIVRPLRRSCAGASTIRSASLARRGRAGRGRRCRCGPSRTAASRCGCRAAAIRCAPPPRAAARRRSRSASRRPRSISAAWRWARPRRCGCRAASRCA